MRHITDTALDCISVYRGEAAIQYMAGDFEGARENLKKVFSLRGKEDIHDLLLMSECSVMLSDGTREGVAELHRKIRDTNIPNYRIKSWARLHFTRPGYNVDSVRSIGGVLLLCGLMKKYEHEGMDREDYVKELRGFMVGIDIIAYHVIRYNFQRRSPLVKFFCGVRTDLRKKLKSYNGDSAVDQACFDHGIISDCCVQKGYKSALQKAVLAVYHIERRLTKPSEFKIYARLLMWQGVLRVKLGEVEPGIVDLEKARAAMDDATDYFDDTDLAYLIHTFKSNMESALEARAKLESVRVELGHDASADVRPQAVLVEVNPQAMAGTDMAQSVSGSAEPPVVSEAAKPQAVAGAVEPEAASETTKSTAVEQKDAAKVISPGSKSKSRKSK